MLKKISRIIKNPKWIIVGLNNMGFHFLNDEKYIKLRYKLYFGQNIDLDNPKTFNEKLNWLKLYNRKDIYTVMVDKYNTKKYVADIIGEEHVISTIGVYDKFEDINFNMLPEKFVIKTTHYSGDVYICKNKQDLNLKKLKKRFNKILKKSLYYYAREWPYKNVKPRIIIEKYIENTNSSEDSLNDYKFFCFNGKVKCFKVDFNRFTKHQANYYNEKLELQPFGEIVCPPDFNHKIVFPDNIQKMIQYAEELSAGTIFLRVDFYNVEGKIYFGELTFYPAEGIGKFTEEEWDKKLGEWIELPIIKNNEKG